MMRTRQRPIRAFTLAELIIAMVLSVMIMGAMGMVIQASFTGREETEVRSDLQQAAQVVSARIARDIRKSSSADYNSGVLTLTPANTSAYTQIQYTQSGSALVMTVTASGGGTTMVTLLGGTNDPVTVNSFTASLRSRTILEDHDNDPDTEDISVTYVTLVSIKLQISRDTETAEVTGSGTLRRNLAKVRAASGL